MLSNRPKVGSEGVWKYRWLHFDSLVTAIWHDTGEGGTAPDIEVGSNEYAHDVVAFEIVGDSLRPLYNYNID